MEWVDRQLEKWSGKTGLPEWAIALTLVLGIDVILATGIVFAVSSGKIGPMTASTAKPKMWSEQELKDRFLLKSMDEIEQSLPYDARATVDAGGNIETLFFPAIPSKPDGEPRSAYFFGRGGRCYRCGFN